jgi:hypothetical protein
VIPTHLFILPNIFTTYMDYCEVYDCLFERVNVILGMPVSTRSDRPAVKQSYGMYVMQAAKLVSF